MSDIDCFEGGESDEPKIEKTQYGIHPGDSEEQPIFNGGTDFKVSPGANTENGILDDQLEPQKDILKQADVTGQSKSQ